MKKYINLSLVLLSLLTINQLYAQEFLSPNAAAFAKYGYMPVSTYTGLPNISIPIYELQVGDIKMPISLSYHASGIKVEEQASWVGLGWNLNAGGVITRVVKGLPDFKYEFVPEQDMGKLINNGSFIDGYLFSASTGNLYTYDSQPDIFTFNFNGYAGQFVYNAYKKECISLTNNRDLQIKYRTDISGFEIITPDGISYIFSKKEIQKVFTRSRTCLNETELISPFSYEDPRQTAPSAWFLEEVRSNTTGKKITLKYVNTENDICSYTEPSSYKILPEITYRNVNIVTDYEEYSQMKYKHSNLMLTHIISDDIDIVFQPRDENRKDLNAGEGNALSKIFIKYGGQTKHEYDFIYDYFCVQGKTKNDAYPNELRLKLLSFGEKGVPPYTFYYNESRQLPARVYAEDFRSNRIPSDYMGSYAKDFFGYYNGVETNKGYLMADEGYLADKPGLDIFSIPVWTTGPDGENYVNDLPLGVPVKTVSDGADRLPKLDYAKTSSLERINYPTGGYTMFTYELHNYSYYHDINFPLMDNDIVRPKKEHPGLRIKEIKDFNNDGIVKNTRKFYYDVLDENFNATNTSSGVLNTAPLFHQLKKMILEVTSESWISTHYIKLIKFSTGSVIPFYDFTGGFIGYHTVKEVLNNNSSIIYKYSTARDNDNASQESFQSNLSIYSIIGNTYIYNNQVTSPNDDFSEGWHNPVYKKGLLKETLFLNNLSKPVKKIKNEYRFGEQQNVVYGTERLIQYLPPASVATNYYANLYSYESGYSELKSQEIINYDETENEISAITEYIYNTKGLLNKQINHMSDNTTKTINYTYPCDIVNDIVNNVSIKNNFVVEKANAIKAEFYNKITYYLSTGLANDEIFNSWIIEKQSELGHNITNYCFVDNVKSDYQKGILRTPSINYDNYFNYNTCVNFLNKSPIFSNVPGLISDEEGKTIVTMADKNMQFPLETISFSNNFVVASKYTQYRMASNNTINKRYDFLLKTLQPSSYFNRVGLGTTTNKIVKDSRYAVDTYYDGYDTYSNLLQYHKVNDANISYIWGYNNTYPVAEAKNASNGSIAYTSFENGTNDGNWIFSGTPVIGTASTGTKYYTLTNGNITKTGLPVINYIVSYWTNNTSAFNIAGTITGYPVKGQTVNGWTYYQHILQNVSSVLISGSGNIDELRLYPADAQMTTYTYDPLFGMTAQTDPNGATTFYEYDSIGRLLRIKDNDGKVLKEYEYIYYAH